MCRRPIPIHICIYVSIHMSNESFVHRCDDSIAGQVQFACYHPRFAYADAPLGDVANLTSWAPYRPSKPISQPPTPKHLCAHTAAVIMRWLCHGSVICCVGPCTASSCWHLSAHTNARPVRAHNRASTCTQLSWGFVFRHLKP